MNRLFSTITSVLLTLSTSLLVFGCKSPAQPQPVRLKVMSYNIRIGAGGGHWAGDPAKINLEPVSRIIQEHNPDIVGTQEVDQFRKRTGGMDQPTWLSQRLNMNVAYAPAYTLATGSAHDEKYGIALLTKYPIAQQKDFPLFKPDYSQSHPKYPPFFSEQRVLLYAPVTISNRQVHVFVTHLGLTLDQREKQLQQIAEITARYPGPKLLMGDFNARPEEPALKLLQPNFNDALTVMSTPPEARKSCPAGLHPKGGIDYIFASPHFRVLSAKVIRDATLASDHNPVIAELELLPQ